MSKKLLRAKEAMEKLGIRKSKFYDDIKKGLLPQPVRPKPGSRATRFIEDELDAVIERWRDERDAPPDANAKRRRRAR